VKFNVIPVMPPTYASEKGLALRECVVYWYSI